MTRWRLFDVRVLEALGDKAWTWQLTSSQDKGLGWSTLLNALWWRTNGKHHDQSTMQEWSKKIRTFLAYYWDLMWIQWNHRTCHWLVLGKPARANIAVFQHCSKIRSPPPPWVDHLVCKFVWQSAKTSVASKAEAVSGICNNRGLTRFLQTVKKCVLLAWAGFPFQYSNQSRLSEIGCKSRLKQDHVPFCQIRVL